MNADINRQRGRFWNDVFTHAQNTELYRVFDILHTEYTFHNIEKTIGGIAIGGCEFSPEEMQSLSICGVVDMKTDMYFLNDDIKSKINMVLL